MVVISVYTYGVKIIKKFRWESCFLGGVPWNPPLCTNGSAGYLMQLSVKVNLDLEKTNQLGESSPNFIFVVVNLDPIILEMRWIDGESWPNDFVKRWTEVKTWGG